MSAPTASVTQECSTLPSLAGGPSLPLAVPSAGCPLLVALSGRVVVSGVSEWLGAVLVVCSIGGWSWSQCLYPIMAMCLG